MSRLGKKPIQLPAGVTAVITGGMVEITGPKGKLSHDFGTLVTLTLDGTDLFIGREGDMGTQRAMQGTAWALCRNMVAGVTTGFKKSLDLIGVGFRVAKKDNGLELALGFSHPVFFAIPDTIECVVDKNTIHLSGIDKQQVGEVAANLRKLKKPEPYKGKGLKYTDEVIKRKAGKAGKAK
ncbi:MAG: 50S ribosomal protein L6 [Patescibacteria group bacterium]